MRANRAGLGASRSATTALVTQDQGRPRQLPPRHSKSKLGVKSETLEIKKSEDTVQLVDVNLAERFLGMREEQGNIWGLPEVTRL